jgi:hypothetical protein
LSIAKQGRTKVLILRADAPSVFDATKAVLRNCHRTGQERFRDDLGRITYKVATLVINKDRVYVLQSGEPIPVELDFKLLIDNDAAYFARPIEGSNVGKLSAESHAMAVSNASDGEGG